MAALTLADLQSFRDALIKARSRGVRSVTDQNGERVEYRSDGELRAALADVESRIAAMQSAAPNVIKFNTTKGT